MEDAHGARHGLGGILINETNPVKVSAPPACTIASFRRSKEEPKRGDAR